MPPKLKFVKAPIEAPIVEELPTKKNKTATDIPINADSIFEPKNEATIIKTNFNNGYVNFKVFAKAMHGGEIGDDAEMIADEVAEPGIEEKDTIIMDEVAKPGIEEKDTMVMDEVAEPVVEEATNLLSNSIPKLQLSDLVTDADTKAGLISGMNAPISIVKVRKSACDTLVRELYQASKDNPNLMNEIKTIIKDRENDNTITNINGWLNYLMIAFEGANVNEKESINKDEEEKKEEKEVEKVPKQKFTLSRDNMNDTNTLILNADIIMFKIISSLFILFKTGSTDVIKKDAQIILYNFIVVSSVKEYLDVGQLYSILDKTYNNNISVDTTDPTKSYRKPMLETIDGAAARIVANQRLASYCNCKLDRNLDFASPSITVSFYIDNINVYKLATWFNNFNNTDSLFSDKYNTIKNNTTSPNDIINAFLQVLNILTDDFTPNNAVTIDIRYYFYASVACFLYESRNGIKHIKENLIELNFDSLCHDNEASKIYRMIMILIFILKNDTDKINFELTSMFPSTFKPNSKSKDELISDFVENNKSKTQNFQIYITKMLEQLLPEQVTIFLFLLNNDYHQIETGLYRRLKNKSCYVFEVLQQSKVIISPFQNSAHDAVERAQSLLPTLKDTNYIFPLYLLHQGVIIPRNTNCAIDTSLHHGASLSIYDINELNNNVYVTAVTRNDAANNNETMSTPITTDIVMPIYIKNFIQGEIGESFVYNNFIYNFNYGNKIDNILKVCPFDDTSICNQYYSIIRYLDPSKHFTFYLGKRGKAVEAKEVLITYMDNSFGDTLLTIAEKVNKEIRDMLSKLYKSCIDHKKTKMGESIQNGKTTFLNSFTGFIDKPVTPTHTNELKLTLVMLTFNFLYLTTILNPDDMKHAIPMITSFSNTKGGTGKRGPDGFIKYNLGTGKRGPDGFIKYNLGKVYQNLNIDQSTINKLNEIVTNFRSIIDKIRRNITDTPYAEEIEKKINVTDNLLIANYLTQNLKDNDYYNNSELKDYDNYDSNLIQDEQDGGKFSNQPDLISRSTFSFDKEQSTFPYRQDTIKIASAPTPTPAPTPAPAIETTAKGLISSTNLNDQTSQFTYDSLFGKYGFYMSIDSDGEYVLNVMDYEFEYKAYLKKYEPEKYLEKYQDNTNDNAESNLNDATNVEGGKRKTIRQKYYKRKTQKEHKKTNKKYTLKISNIKKSNIKMSNKRNTKRVKLHS